MNLYHYTSIESLYAMLNGINNDDFEKLNFSTFQLLKSKIKSVELNTIKLEKSKIPLI